MPETNGAAINVTNDAVDALGKGVGGVQSVADWIVDNRADLPLGFAVAAAIVAVMLAIRWFGGWLVAGDPHCTRWRGVIGRVLGKTTILFMVAAALDIVTTYAEVPVKISRLIDIFFIIAFALLGAIWARELILGVIGRRAGNDPGETHIGNAMSIIRVLVSVALFAIAIIVILDNLGVNVTALIAGFGIGGIAIGLAAQGIFADLFAALAILFDKPFRRGDTVKYDTSSGVVERIGLKTTRLRSLSGETLVMANRNLLDKEIHNFAGGFNRRTTLNFGLIYQTDPDMLEQVPAIAGGVVKQRSGCQLVRCDIVTLGASSIDFELVFESATVDADIVAADRTAIIINLLRTFATHGLEFAYPTQTTFTAAPDGTMIMPYAAVQPVAAVDSPTSLEAQRAKSKRS
jgi:small-conductance mechanosensitive channel